MLLLLMGISGRSRPNYSEETYGGATGSADNNLARKGVDIGTGGAQGHAESTHVRVVNDSVILG